MNNRNYEEEKTRMSSTFSHGIQCKFTIFLVFPPLYTVNRLWKSYFKPVKCLGSTFPCDPRQSMLMLSTERLHITFSIVLDLLLAMLNFYTPSELFLRTPMARYMENIYYYKCMLTTTFLQCRILLCLTILKGFRNFSLNIVNVVIVDEKFLLLHE